MVYIHEISDFRHVPSLVYIDCVPGSWIAPAVIVQTSSSVAGSWATSSKLAPAALYSPFSRPSTVNHCNLPRTQSNHVRFLSNSVLDADKTHPPPSRKQQSPRKVLPLCLVYHSTPISPSSLCACTHQSCICLYTYHLQVSRNQAQHLALSHFLLLLSHCLSTAQDVLSSLIILWTTTHSSRASSAVPPSAKPRP